MATQHLAAWSHGLRYADLPENVVRAAVQSFYNWAGCAIGGSRHEATTIAARIPPLSTSSISVLAAGPIHEASPALRHGIRTPMVG